MHKNPVQQILGVEWQTVVLEQALGRPSEHALVSKCGLSLLPMATSLRVSALTTKNPSLSSV